MGDFYLKTAEELKAWLSREENTFGSNLYIVSWKGCWPSISKGRLYLLDDPGFLDVILREHLARRVAPPEEEGEKTDG